MYRAPYPNSFCTLHVDLVTLCFLTDPFLPLVCFVSFPFLLKLYRERHATSVSLIHIHDYAHVFIMIDYDLTILTYTIYAIPLTPPTLTGVE